MINVKLIQMDVGVPCYSQLHKNGVGAIAAVGAAASLIGAGVSAYSQHKTNESNELINQQNLDYQKWAMLEEERFNSQPNQRALIEQAGYSPYAFLGGASSSVGGSSAPSPIAMQNPVQPGMFDKLSEMIYNFQDMRSEVAKKDSETNLNTSNTVAQNIANEYADKRQIWEIAQMRNNAELLGHKSEVERLNGQLAHASFDARVRKFMLDTELMERQIDQVAADTALTTYNAVIAQKNSQWIDKLNSQQVKESLARIATEVSQMKLNYAATKREISAVLQNEAGARKLNIEAKRLEDTADDFARGIYYDTTIKKWQSIHSGFETANSFDPYHWDIFDAWSNGKSVKPATAVGAAGHFFNNLTPKLFK